MTVVLIDSGGANIGSVQYALERLGVQAPVSRDADEIRRAERVILPGVGAAAPAMRRLRELDLVELLRSLTQPVLGICLGMQLLYEYSEEGGVECLGLLPGRVRRLAPRPGVRVPHMGWNHLAPQRESRLSQGLTPQSQAYFVHGYAVPVGPECVTRCEHGDAFAAMVERGNVMGAQFHPERSGTVGARVLANFLGVTA